MGVAALEFNLDIRPHFLRVLWLRLDTPKDNPSLTPMVSEAQNAKFIQVRLELMVIQGLEFFR